MSLEVEDLRITRCHKCSDWGPRDLPKHKSDRVPKTWRFAFIQPVEKSEDIDGGLQDQLPDRATLGIPAPGEGLTGPAETRPDVSLRLRVLTVSCRNVFRIKVTIY